MSEWQPGDVGVSTLHGYRSIYVAACRIGEHGRGGGPCWHNESGFSDPADSHRRRLVVIDYDDRDQVERLVALHYGPGYWSTFLSTRDSLIEPMQAALREFANPTPPIEEPSSLYAVVEDRGGDQWCHVGERVWRSLTSTGQFMVEKHWHDAGTPLAGNVVRVLSEGVTDV